MAKIRVLIADDHAILREGLRALLAATEDIEVVGEAADGHEALERCARLRPDVLLIDVAMPGLGGLEATLQLRREQPEVKVVVLTQYDDQEYVQRFLQARVSGYLLKQSAGTELAAAIRAAARGGLVLDPAVAQQALAAPAAAASGGSRDYDALTDREKQVLKLVAEGRSNKEVATLLGISVKTAMSHREHIMDKLDLHSRTELIKFALRAGVIRVED
ncbi:MAG TPA: response regulator transcription factor [Candidatus Polarisedimenticolaceae bacterium]|nr:response regulator transcription factor [Candidatus Polarisedimenticolaceae bacterium]